MKRIIPSPYYLLLLALILILPACDDPPGALATLASTAGALVTETANSPQSTPTAESTGTPPPDIDTPQPQPDADSTDTAEAETAYAAIVARQETSTPTLPPLNTPIPTPKPPQMSSYEIINTYPHDPNAFTQGLVYFNGGLYEGTGRWGESTLREVVLETGAVLRSHSLEARYFGEGITLFNDKIYQLTWQEQTGFVYDRSTFEVVQTFSYPHEGWGITHDGQRLIVSDGTSTIYFWDPATLQEIGHITVRDHEGPLNRLNELEYIDGEIWANIWLTDIIARISPETGDVLGYVDLTGLLDTSALTQPVDVLNGVAHDPETDRLFVTGKLWPVLFEIRIVPKP